MKKRHEQNRILRIGKLVTVYLTVLLFGLMASAQTPLVLSDASYSYTQNFDGISDGLPPEWLVYTNATSADPGTMNGFNTNALSWDSSTAEFVNYASTMGNDGTSYIGNESAGIQTASTNRAPGIRLSDSGAAFVLLITNTLGFANFQLTADFLDLGTNANTNTWTVDYALGDAPTNFIPAAAYVSPGVFGATTRNIPFGNALDDQPQTVWIRIASLIPRNDSQQQDAFGVDNVVLNYTIAPALHILQMGANVVISWSDLAKYLVYSDGLAGPWYYVDSTARPYTNAITGKQRFFSLTDYSPGGGS